jgi:hypothetical protein
MIIASPAKKEISIPLQPMASAVAFLATKDHQEDQPSAVDLVTISPRNKGKLSET